jgi:hypothetical protein
LQLSQTSGLLAGHAQPLQCSSLPASSDPLCTFRAKQGPQEVEPTTCLDPLQGTRLSLSGQLSLQGSLLCCPGGSLYQTPNAEASLRSQRKHSLSALTVQRLLPQTKLIVSLDSLRNS